MKKLLIATLALGLMTNAVASDEVIDPRSGTDSSGRITVTGKVIASTCYLDTRDVDIVKTLPTVESNVLRRAGAVSKERTNVDIRVHNCPIEYQNKEQNVGIKFVPNPNSVQDVSVGVGATADAPVGVLKNTALEATAAKNVGIQIYDLNGAQPALVDLSGDNQNTTYKALRSLDESGAATFKFQLAYRSTGGEAVTPGNVQGTLPFIINYK